MFDAQTERSAGTIIFRNDPVHGPCVLMLKTYNHFDLPKGHVEKKDASLFSAAARETVEECGFTINKDPTYSIDSRTPTARLLYGAEEPITCYNVNSKTGEVKKIVYLFPVETACKKVVILPNAKSGVLEHQGHKWVPVDEIASSGLHKYLQDGVIVAVQTYFSHLRVAGAVTKLNTSR